MVKRPRGDEQAGPDDLGRDPGQVGPDSAGQSGDPQQLSHVPEADNESVEELADTDQALEAARVEGVEDAADHPERPTHTHNDYGRPDDVPPRTELERRGVKGEDIAPSSSRPEERPSKKSGKDRAA